MLTIFTSFIANIVVLFQSTSKSIRSVSDLMNPKIGIGVEDAPYSRYYFPQENEPSKRALFTTRIEPPNGPNAYMNITYGIERVREGMFAFHTFADHAYYQIKRTFLEHEKCGMIEINFFRLGAVWYVIQKHSPYKEILKIR